MKSFCLVLSYSYRSSYLKTTTANCYKMSAVSSSSPTRGVRGRRRPTFQTNIRQTNKPITLTQTKLLPNKGFSYHTETKIFARSFRCQLRKRNQTLQLKWTHLRGVYHSTAKRAVNHLLHNHELQTLSCWSMASFRQESH